MAWRNRRCPIHRFSSTSVRCITAIWPAGPPKVCSEIRNQARTAVRNGTTACCCGRAVEGRFIGTPDSRRLSAEQQAATVVLVETVENRSGDREGLLVAARHRQPAQDHIQTGCLRSVELLLVEVGLVHGLGYPPEHRVGDVVAAQDPLEG